MQITFHILQLKVSFIFTERCIYICLVVHNVFFQQSPMKIVKGKDLRTRLAQPLGAQDVRWGTVVATTSPTFVPLSVKWTEI